MKRSTRVPAVVVALVAAALVLPGMAGAQSHDHGAASGASAAREASPPAAPAGQAAFEAIADAVKRLEADPATDWSRVDVEGLRLHLLDMDRVFTEARVESVEVEGGARFTVSGRGEAAGSIQRMAAAHARALEGSEYRAAVETTAEGAIVSVTAADGSAATAAKIRGLGFAGLLALDDHHARHHWMLASGARPPGH